MTQRRSLPWAVPLLVLAEITLVTCRADSPMEPQEQPAPPRSSPQVTTQAAEVLVGAGQIARCDRARDEKTAALLDSIPGTVFTTGDNVRAGGTATDFSTCYDPSWGRHKARTRPAPGDLDYQSAGAAGYFGYFGATAGDADKGYYSYELGSWHVIALNSNISMAVGSPQEQWLRADLASSANQCVLAYWHHPRFSSKGTAVRTAVKPLWDALYAAGADLILNSHYQLYERFAPQSPTGVSDPQQGIRQFTVGTGGHGAEAFSSTVRPNSQVRQSGTYGVLKLTLSPGSYSWQFVPIAGQTFTDTGADLCDRQGPVSSVDVAPAVTTVTAGSTVQLTATSNGTPITQPVTWATSNPDVATVASDGVVSGVADGSAVITATVDGQSGASAITVTPLPPPSPPGSSAVFVGAGDIATCGGTQTGDEATAALLDNIAGTVFNLGDLAYEAGTASEFTNCYGPSWGRHRSRTRPVPGNHEYETVGASGYYGYFGSSAGDANKGYYSYDLADWHIIALNSNISMVAGSAQEQWLRADLASSTQQCTLAYWHHPRFNSGSHHGSDITTQPLWQALYEAGADVILSAHEHLYERFAPQQPNGTADPSTGIRQFTVGTGGRSLYQFGPALANSEVRNSTSRGVLKLTLSPGSYTWQFVPVEGAAFTDSGSGDCHGPPTTTPPPPGATTAITLTPTDTLRLGLGGATGTLLARAWAGSQEVARPIKWWIRANGVATLSATQCTSPCSTTVTAAAIGVTLVDVKENVAGSTAARDQAHVKVTSTLE